MNYYKLVQLNKRQFERQCNIEGQEVLNFSKDITEKVIFGKTSNSRTSQDKAMIYYRVDGSIEKGDIIYYGDYYYVVINENYHENEAWRKSAMVKCNTIWNIFGQKVPLVASDLSSPNPTNGSFSSTINGTINFYTKDIPILHEKIGVNDIFYDFGGCYKLVNKFFVDGLAYLYFERTTADAAVSLEMTYTGNLQYEISEKKIPLYFFVGYIGTSGNHYVPTAKIRYTVDNQEIAIIDENGYLIPLSEGTIKVNASATGYIENGGTLDSDDYFSVSLEKSITIVSGSGSSNFLEITLTSAGTAKEIGIGSKKPLYVLEYDGNQEEVELTQRPTCTFQFIDSSGNILADANQYVTDISDSSIPVYELYFKLSDDTAVEDYVDNYLRVNVTTENGTTGYIDLKIVW